MFLALVKGHVLLPPKARPPPESINELLDVDFPARAGKGGMAHPDGAPAYAVLVTHPPYWRKKLRTLEVPVGHKNNGFTQAIRKAAGFSALTGTQSARPPLRP